MKDLKTFMTCAVAVGLLLTHTVRACDKSFDLDYYTRCTMLMLFKSSQTTAVRMYIERYELIHLTNK